MRCKLSHHYKVLGEGWLRYPLCATQKRSAKWSTTFHGSHWYTLYSVLKHGLLESKTNIKKHHKSKKPCQGVYSFIAKEHCNAYCNWIIMPDGVFWALMYELLVDMNHHMHRAPGAKQQCSARKLCDALCLLTHGCCRDLVIAQHWLNTPPRVVCTGSFPTQNEQPLGRWEWTPRACVALVSRLGHTMRSMDRECIPSLSLSLYVLLVLRIES